MWKWIGLIGVAVFGGLFFWYITVPERLNAQDLASFPEGNAAAGERIFNIGGCASCHAAPKSKGDKRFELPGGVALATPFGTFVAPNLSPHPRDGIGSWQIDDFANAMLRGVSPDGRHYYPAFPYASYIRMTPADIADLFAFLKTLPPIEGIAPAHELSFPFNIRRGIGLWKLLNLAATPVIAIADNAPEDVRLGAYMVEGPGHCGECHTPRDLAGGLKYDQWLAGAVAAEGDGIVPNITPGESGIGDWSEAEISYFFETGFTPEFDSVGGTMAAVQRNLAELSESDRAAIAAYLKAVPPRPNAYPANR